MKKLYIIDGSGFLFRAYYGVPPLHNDQGFPVHAIFGVCKMMLNLLMDQPDYFVIARDAPQKTIRHTQYEDYKAGRPPCPDDLKRQIGHVKEVINQLGIPALEFPGYEADDIIGTLANKYKEDKNLHISVITNDKDMKQLITDNVICYDAMRYITTTYKSFLEEHEYEPTSIVDFLALVGDASDNIKGVPGIGKVGAAKLIKKYHTVENIYKYIEEITGSTKQKLVDGRESAKQSKSLIELMTVPGFEETPITTFEWKPDFQHIEEVLIRDWQFNSLEKTLAKIKKLITMPTQHGLFG